MQTIYYIHLRSTKQTTQKTKPSEDKLKYFVVKLAPSAGQETDKNALKLISMEGKNGADKIKTEKNGNDYYGDWMLM